MKTTFKGNLIITALLTMSSALNVYLFISVNKISAGIYQYVQQTEQQQSELHGVMEEALLKLDFIQSDFESLAFREAQYLPTESQITDITYSDSSQKVVVEAPQNALTQKSDINKKVEQVLEGGYLNQENWKNVDKLLAGGDRETSKQIWETLHAQIESGRVDVFIE